MYGADSKFSKSLESVGQTVNLIIFSSDDEPTVKRPAGLVINSTTVCSDKSENTLRLRLLKKT